MRMLAVAILAISAVSVTSPARAQTYNPRYPVCLKLIENFGSEYNECLYTSLQQCAQSALGRPAQCIMNPFYASEAAPRGRDRRYRSDY